MIFDRQNMFSDGQAISGTSATGSTDCIDLGPFYSGVGGANLVKDLGVGEDIYLSVSASGVSGTNPVVTIAIETDSSASFGSATTLASYGPVALPAAGGQVLNLCLPFGDYKQFVRLKFTQGGTSPVATYKAALTRGVQAVKNYTDAIVIS
jgi:hypothetical protein